MTTMHQPWQAAVFAVSIRKKEKWRWAKPHLQHAIYPGARCLDVGSGVGTLSMRQEKIGGEWHFIETDAAAAKETAAVVAGPVWTIDIFNQKLLPGTYDLITIFDVIEHVPNPTLFLARAQELLTPHGRIILTTPADDGSWYFWRRLADSFFGIDKSAHGHVVEGFSREQLRSCCTGARLHIVAAEQFSFFFTEMVELLYNGAYILKNRIRQTTGGYNLALSPASGTDVTRHRTQLALLRIVYPALRSLSLLDRLSLLTKGYEWGLVAKRTADIERSHHKMRLAR